MSPTPPTGADLVLHEVRALRAVVDSLFAQLQPERWQRKSEQRDKWKLRASGRAAKGLARRSF